MQKIDKIDIKKLSEDLGCKKIEISALKGTGIQEISEAAVTSGISEQTYAKTELCTSCGKCFARYLQQN